MSKLCSHSEKRDSFQVYVALPSNENVNNRIIFFGFEKLVKIIDIEL